MLATITFRGFLVLAMLHISCSCCESMPILYFSFFELRYSLQSLHVHETELETSRLKNSNMERANTVVSEKNLGLNWGSNLGLSSYWTDASKICQLSYLKSSEIGVSTMSWVPQPLCPRALCSTSWPSLRVKCLWHNLETFLDLVKS